MNVHGLPAGSRYVSKAVVHDPRWPKVGAVLATLRASGRHAVRIVDIDCGAGTLLLHALEQARRLGFTAIEGRGTDGSALLIGRARAALTRFADPAIGVDFAVADMFAALADEHYLPADIVLCHDVARDWRPEAAFALRNAGRIVIDDDAGSHVRGIAA
ncbi:SAM-dependent methyltransferase [Sphingomonas sp. R86521]|uniref:SAM-dependent methyltransferase n=1 Tax=Sphingomonas sp. R86521 TaxID=3093860 RepID=UPI0036D3234A